MNDNFDTDNLIVTDEIKSSFTNIIDLLGEDSGREGLIKTPERASKAMQIFDQKDMIRIRTQILRKCYV